MPEVIHVDCPEQLALQCFCPEALSMNWQDSQFKRHNVAPPEEARAMDGPSNPRPPPAQASAPPQRPGLTKTPRFGVITVQLSLCVTIKSGGSGSFT